MAKARERVMDTADTYRPYVERAIKDEDIRENVKSAMGTARRIYDELIGARGLGYAAARVATDKDMQEDLRSAIDDLRDAARRVQGKESHTARNTALLITGIALGILFNPVTGPSTRKWLMDVIAGEDEFGESQNESR